jgi:hypothetical protein
MFREGWGEFKKGDVVRVVGMGELWGIRTAQV